MKTWPFPVNVRASHARSAAAVAAAVGALIPDPDEHD